MTAGTAAGPRARGRPLEPLVRDRLESAFGENLSTVRVRDDAQAARDVRVWGARAFAREDEIAVGQPLSALGTSGLGLAAHEVAHVLQQRRGGDDPTARHEAEAESAAHAVVSGQPATVALGSRPGVIQLAPSDRAPSETPGGRVEEENAGVRARVEQHPDPNVRNQASVADELATTFGDRVVLREGAGGDYLINGVPADLGTLKSTDGSTIRGLIQSKRAQLAGGDTSHVVIDGSRVGLTEAQVDHGIDLYRQILERHPKPNLASVETLTVKLGDGRWVRIRLTRAGTEAGTAVSQQSAPDPGGPPLGADELPSASGSPGAESGTTGLSAPPAESASAPTTAAAPTIGPVEEPVTPGPAARGTGMVITTALMLAAELVIWHVSAKLAESERANIKLGWRLAVVPEIESVIEVLHRRWRANLEARPTQETYLVVVYGITFEEQWDFATRQVFAVSIPVWPERPIAAGGSRQRAVPD